MDIHVYGTGSFGSFLQRELPNHGFTLHKNADTVILAVPFSAYEIVARELTESGKDRVHLINVCSTQTPSTEALLKYTERVTSIHPLFGSYTPPDKRYSILTYATEPSGGGASASDGFMSLWAKFSKITDWNSFPSLDGCIEHDKLMAKTHVMALLAAKRAQPFVEAAKDVPDELVPNSFRLLREFVRTMEDTPSGTIESIMANPFIN